jgi:soluble P-type ATPase
MSAIRSDPIRITFKQMGCPQMQITIPGTGSIELKHLVCDYNGTIARDGHLMSNLDKTFAELAGQFTIHVLTADSGGTVTRELEGLPCRLHIITPGNEAEQKEAYILELGAESVACIGNGANDRLMLKSARLGIAVLEGEGAATGALLHADIVVRSIYDALGLFMVPQRITATLRT